VLSSNNRLLQSSRYNYELLVLHASAEYKKYTGTVLQRINLHCL